MTNSKLTHSSESASPQSGSSNDGLIFAWEIKGDGKGKKLDWKEVEENWNKEGLFWLHLNFEDPTAQDWLIQHSGVDSSLLPYLLSDDSRPGAFVHENKLLMIIRGINSNTDAEPEDLISLRLYLAPDQLISMRRRKVQTMEEMNLEISDGKGVKNASQFLIEVISKEVERIGKYVEKLEEDVSELERLIIESEIVDVSDDLHTLQSVLIDLRRYLHPQRIMFGKLLDEQLDWLDTGTYNRIRTQVEFHTRHVEDIDYCWQRTQVIKEELNTRQTEQLNKKLYILAIVSCVFLPLSLITGLLGVNVAGIPFANNPAAFSILFGGMLVLAGLILFYFKRKRWF